LSKSPQKPAVEQGIADSAAASIDRSEHAGRGDAPLAEQPQKLDPGDLHLIVRSPFGSLSFGFVLDRM